MIEASPDKPVSRDVGAVNERRRKHRRRQQTIDCGQFAYVVFYAAGRGPVVIVFQRLGDVRREAIAVKLGHFGDTPEIILVSVDTLFARTHHGWAAVVAHALHGWAAVVAYATLLWELLHQFAGFVRPVGIIPHGQALIEEVLFQFFQHLQVPHDRFVMQGATDGVYGGVLVVARIGVGLDLCGGRRPNARIRAVHDVGGVGFGGEVGVAILIRDHVAGGTLLGGSAASG